MNPHGSMAPDAALAAVLALPPPRRIAWVPLVHSVGRVCAEDIVTRTDLPPFDRATMDGFAVSMGTSGEGLTVVAKSEAGGSMPPPLPAGSAAAITTGAVVPHGAHAVVPIEKVRVDGNRIHFEGAFNIGANVVPRGAEGAAGSPLFPRGRVFTAHGIAAAAAAGYSSIPIWAPPTVGVLVTGDEVGGTGESHIPDANGPLVQGMLASLGITGRLVHAGDTLEELEAAFAGIRDCDVVITTGGVSMGPRDLIPPLLRKLGAHLILHGVAQKPGKPMLVATLGTTAIFSLPGNPLAVHLGMHRYVLPHLKAGLWLPTVPRMIQGRLEVDAGPVGPRDEFIPVDISLEGEGPILVTPHPANSSGHLLALARARGLWHRLRNAPAVPAGTGVVVELLEGTDGFGGGFHPIPIPAIIVRPRTENRDATSAPPSKDVIS